MTKIYNLPHVYWDQSSESNYPAYMIGMCLKVDNAYPVNIGDFYALCGDIS